MMWDIKDLTPNEQKEVQAVIEATGYSLEDALDIFDSQSYQYYPEMTLVDVAEELVESGAFGEIPESLMFYIDYEAIARDLKHDGYIEVTDGVIIVD